MQVGFIQVVGSTWDGHVQPSEFFECLSGIYAVNRILIWVLCLSIASETVLGVAVSTARACSRVVHTSRDGKLVVTGRNMDWFEDIQSNLWLFPSGLEHDGAVSKNPHRWTSRYGSVITAGFDVGTTDGLNEKGLAVNLLYLAEADFGERDVSRPGVSWSAYAQYLLDTYATVAEAVAGERGDKIQLVASPLPGSVSKPPALHFSLSDATGDSAIFEHIQGKLLIHHGREFRVMTNSPIFDEQLALNKYWDTVGGDAMLPGTRRAADRFVRASFYEKRLPNPTTSRQAVANVMSVMRNVSAPFGEPDAAHPNISATIWRTVADHTNRVYYFESTSSPSLVWVRLDSVDLKKGSPVKRLKLGEAFEYSGDVSSKFEATKPFAFVGPKE